MAVVTTVRPIADYEWLSTDRDTIEFTSLRQTIKSGQYGRELDTGKEYYFSVDKSDWVEFKRPEVVLLEQLVSDIARSNAEQARLLRQIRNAAGEMALGKMGDGIPADD